MSTIMKRGQPKKKKGLTIDLNYKQLQAIVMFQTLYKERRRNITYLNKKLNLIYSTLMSVVDVTSTNFQRKVISVDKYKENINKVDDIIQLYEELPNPITIDQYKEPMYHKYNCTVRYIEYKTFELVKLCGAARCEDIMRISIGPNWNNGARPSFMRLMKFFSNVFVPISVKITSLNTGHNLLPEVKKLGVFSHSTLLKMHGAELNIPIYGKLIAIRGYFKNDPLNMSRIGGTVGKKYMDLIDDCETKCTVRSERFRTQFIEQISLRDFMSLNINQLIKMIEDGHDDLKKMKMNNKLSSISADFHSSTIEKKSKLITLLLLDKESEGIVSNLIATMLSDSKKVDEIYRNLHWSIQKKFDKVFKEVENSGEIIDVDEESIPYETRIENMSCSDSIKRRAYDKLKEIKNSRDGNDKATKYLDNLLRVPFTVFKKEKMLRFLGDFKKEFAEFYNELIDYQLHEEPNNLLPLIEIIKEEKGDKSIESFTSTELDHFFECIHSTFSTYDKDALESEGSENEEMYAEKLKLFDFRWNEYTVNRQEYMKKCRERLDKSIWGQVEAKKKVESVIGQWVNGEMEGAVLGFRGPPGTGKTSIAKEGISKCLQDEDGSFRPVEIIDLGGSVNASKLVGHGYTYVTSKWGALVDRLIQSKCMNPIIIFDELDKVSETAHGEEIISVLTKLTDPLRNNQMSDSFFDGIDFDFSKCLIIFTYNKAEKISDILMSRITEVPFMPLNKYEKVYIGHNYLAPKILKSVGYTNKGIILTDEAIVTVTEGYVYEAGVRQLKEKLYDIFREVNLRVMNGDLKVPITVTPELVDDILERKNKILIKKIPNRSQPGLVNGLYATESGIGGITSIQISDTLTDHKFSLELTGRLGDVMKESNKCAKTITWKTLPKEIKTKFTDEWKDNPYGFHIHYPSAGMPKDGPSAGVAITVALISYMSGLKARRYVAMTGEIDLRGYSHRIGGVPSKVEGAYRAGAKLVLLPKDNLCDWEEIKGNYVDTDLRVFTVSHVFQVIDILLINDDKNTLEKFGMDTSIFSDEDRENLFETRYCLLRK